MYTPNLEARDDNELFYGKRYALLEATEKEITHILESVGKQCLEVNARNPIEHYKTRIKAAKSAKAKLRRLGLPQTPRSALANLFDIVGARIVCRFADDIYLLANILRRMKGVSVVREKDYILMPKQSGYRSLHIVIQIPVRHLGKIRIVNVEVQMRTIAMDFWASLEHELRYKKDVPDAKLMSMELKRCADEIASVDLSMQVIYEWIHDNG